MSQAASAHGGTVRRSARLSSVARSTGSHSVAVASSATPSRRKGPLPKVKARQSTAYGASGRLGAAEELAVPVTGFLQAFEVQRGAAVARNDDLLMSGALDVLSDASSDLPDETSTPSLAGNESEDPPSDEDPEESAVDTSKSFGMSREAGMLSAMPHPVLTPANGRPPRQKISPPTRPAPEMGIRRHIEVARRAESRPVAVRPTAEDHVRTFAPRPLRRPAEDALEDSRNGRQWFSKWFSKQYLVAILIGLLAAAALLLLIPSPPDGTPNNSGTANAFRNRISYMFRSIADLVGPKLPEAPFPHHPDTEYDTMYSWVLGKHNQLIKDIEGNTREIRTMRGTLSTIQDQLPQYLVIMRKKDGSFDIDDDFWKALHNKMQSEAPSGPGTPSKDWDNFLKKNEARIQDILGKNIDLTKAKAWPELVLRQEFTNAMEKRWHDLSEQVDKRIAEQVGSLTKEFKKFAVKEAKQAHIDQMRLQSLAWTNLIANAELNLQKTNYFSPGLGARIDPSITSATVTDTPAIIPRLYSRIVPNPQRRPPSAALQPWDEPGECWCAAKDSTGSGKAQLGITLPLPMYPTQITIEHLPKTAAPREDISNAPREVEVWVQTPEAPTFHFKEAEGRCGPAPAPGWVCLGRVTYDIRGANHVQTFNLNGQSSVPVSKAMVRVVNNWGNDHTCIYRVRLHGHEDGPKHEYPVFN